MNIEVQSANAKFHSFKRNREKIYQQAEEFMQNLITTEIIGILVCVLGILNMSGNISSLHKYHRHRVSEENKKPFGKLVGGGTLIVGVGLIVYGVLTFLAEQAQSMPLEIVGICVLISAIIVGMIIVFYGMKKYNGGIF